MGSTEPATNISTAHRVADRLRHVATVIADSGWPLEPQNAIEVGVFPDEVEITVFKAEPHQLALLDATQQDAEGGPLREGRPFKWISFQHGGCEVTFYRR